METSFNLASRVPEISSPCSLKLLHIKEKLFMTKTCLRLGSFSNQDHPLVPGSGLGRLRVSHPLMLGPLQDSYTGEKRIEEETGLSLRTVRTLLIDNYDSYTYNIYQELAIINGVPPLVVHNDEWTWDYICHCLYNLKAFDNIVISPGPGSPTCPADIGICSRLLFECKDIPILGVCLGHQALGYVHGARIVHAPQPVHGRLSEIEHIGCNLFHNIPSGKNSGFKVVRYHSLVLDADTLPKELIPIAWTSSARTQSFLENQECDITDGVDFTTSSVTKASFQRPKNSEDMENTKVIMGVMHSTRPHYGVQFHPESIATRYGRQIFENFRHITLDYWLNSSPVQERKISHAYQPCIEPPIPKNKILVGNGTEGDWVDVCKKVVNQHKSMDHKYLKLDHKYLKLRWRKFVNLANQVGGSRNIFCELFGYQEAKDTFWLDSSSIDQRRARFSFMGGRGGSLWKQITFWLSDQSNATGEAGGYLSIEDARGSTRRTFLDDGFLDFLNKELQSFLYDKEEYEELPFDFCGGYIGFIGYGIKVECGMASNRHKSRTPDACFFFADRLVVVDHSNGDVYILSIHNNHPNGISEAGSRENLDAVSWLDETERQLLGLKAPVSKKLNTQLPSPRTSTPCKEGFVIDKSRDQYVKDVYKCLNLIRDGESYELCLTTQMRKSIRDLDALGFYLSLRQKNPAPYAAWFHFAKEDLCICCSSPERFLRLDRNGILEAKPIKGTITRGMTPEEDEQLKLQLQHSEKDQAENLMIVDLLRNDLGRVCKPGTVHVPRLMEVESYATVHTLVSTIRGEKRTNLSPIECVRAAFPGGSMTGAPKLRSMELLDSIEGCSRGVYSGSIGFFSYNQTFDLNIVIRTVVIHKNEASIGAGGAIVALSNPEDEYDEMILKARAPAQTMTEHQTRSDSFSRTSMKK